MINDKDILWKHGSSKIELFSKNGKNLVTIFFFNNKYIIQLGKTTSGRVASSALANDLILSITKKYYSFSGEERDLADFIDMYEEIQEDYKSKGIYAVLYLGNNQKDNFDIYKNSGSNSNKYKVIKDFISLGED